MPDPWLTDSGDVVPALKVAGMPEWTNGPVYRLRYAGCYWFVDWYDSMKGAWYADHRATPHEAAAIIEKWLREWLALCYISVYWDDAWLVFDSDTRKYVMPGGSWGEWEDAKRFSDYPEAQQAAVPAAKE